MPTRSRRVLPLAILAASWVASAERVVADPLWRSAGLVGGTVSALAVDPSVPGVVYAGTPDVGVWKSTDGGGTWRAANRGIERSAVSDIDVDPSDSNHLLAATTGGLCHSADGGDSWACSDRQLALLARVGAGPTLYGTSRQAILRSDDGGRSWQPTSALAAGFYVHDLVADPDRAAVAYAATNGGVLKTVDGGAHWRLVNRGLSTDPRAIFTVAIVVDAMSSTTLYVANLDGATVFRSGDGGDHWAPILGPLGADGETDVTAIVSRPEALLVAVNRLLPRRRGELWQSDDAGATWRLARITPELQGMDATADGRHVYAGLFGSGLLVSDDAGASWRGSRRGLAALGAGAVGVDPRGVDGPLVATVAAGVFNGAGAGLEAPGPRGRGWQASDRGLAFRGFAPTLTSVVFDSVRPKVVYAAGSDGVYRSGDGGGQWARTPALGSLSELMETASGEVWAVGREYVPCGIPFCGLIPVPSVWHSQDGGDTWERAAEGIDPGGAPPSRYGELWTVAGDPGNGWVYAGGAVGSSALFARTTLAGPWTARPAAGLPGTVTALLTLPQSAPPPGTPTPLLAAVATTGAGPRLWRSSDLGATFQPSAQGLPNDLVIHRLLATVEGRALFAATSRGVYQSSDDGASWQPVGGRLRGEDVLGLGWAPATGTLYAATPRPPGLFAYQP